MAKRAKRARHPRNSSKPRGELAGGKRVYLRRPRQADEREYVALRKRSRAFLEKWEPRSTRSVDRFAVSGFRHVLRRSRSRSRLFTLVCLRETGAIIGAVSLNEIVRGSFQSATMGYWIGREFARQGLMSEAVDLMIRHAFTSLRLHRVEANIIPRNKPSIALARTCGLHYEGTARYYLQIGGRWEDHEHWSVTIETWRPAPTPST